MVPWGWGADAPTESRSYADRVVSGARRRYFTKYAYPGVRSRLIANLTHLPRALCNGLFHRAVRMTDLVVSTGGHHVTSLLTSNGVSNQICDLAMATLAGKPVVLWSQSIGPLEFMDPRDLEMVTAILTRAAKIYVRDRQSYDIMRQHKVSLANVVETFDSVVGLGDAIGEYVPPSRRENSVGISIYSAQKRSVEAHRQYVNTIVGAVSHASRMGALVRFFPMELKGSISDDRWLITEIVSSCRRMGLRCAVEDRDLDTLTHLREVAKCRVFIGHKTHSVVFGLTVGTPMLAIAYHPKTRDFMERYGLQEQCIDEKDLVPDVLEARFKSILCNAESIGAKQFQNSQVLGARVRNDFKAMLRSVANVSRE